METNLRLGLGMSFSSVNLELGIFDVRTRTPCKVIKGGGEYDSASRTHWGNVFSNYEFRPEECVYSFTVYVL